MIAKTEYQKNLGVFISSDPKLDIHLKNAARKALNVFFITKRNFSSLPSSTEIELYKSIILPTMMYGSNCGSATSITDVELLENVQNF